MWLLPAATCGVTALYTALLISIKALNGNVLKVYLTCF